eukprot:jgi/Picsp_1/6303/NSC_03652-R1_hypothetical protein CHLNCDRAFT_145384 [Chlorella variabilis]
MGDAAKRRESRRDSTSTLEGNRRVIDTRASDKADVFHIERLPKEVLVMVLRQLDPDDVRQTRLVSRTLYQVSNEALKVLQTRSIEAVEIFPLVQRLETRAFSGRERPGRSVWRWDGCGLKTRVQCEGGLDGAFARSNDTAGRIIGESHEASHEGGSICSLQDAILKCHLLRALKIRGSEPGLLDSCVFQLKKLECLELIDVPMGGMDLAELKNMSSLRLLRFQSCSGVDYKSLGLSLGGMCHLEDVAIEGSGDLPDALLCGIGKLEHLTSLDLSSCDTFTAHGLEALKDCRSLKRLLLPACWNVDDQMCKAIADFMPQLECLSLFESGEDMSGVGLAQLKKLKHLKEMDFGYVCGYFSSADLVGMLQGMKGLTMLNISGTDGVDDDVLEAVTCNLTSLTRLDISECQSISEKGTRSLQKLIQLKELDCGWNSRLSDALVEGFPRGLTRLDLSYCSGLTDNGIKSISELKQLKVLNLRRCSQLRNKSLEYISRCANIVSLDISYTGMSSRGLEKLHMLEKLEHLDMCGCSHAATVTGLASLRHVKSLKALNVSMTSRIDDGCLHSISFLPHLHTLAVRRCPKISDFGIFELKRLKKLRKLEINGCRKITENSLKVLKRHCVLLHDVDSSGIGAEPVMDPDMCENRPLLYHRYF